MVQKGEVHCDEEIDVNHQLDAGDRNYRQWLWGGRNSHANSYVDSYADFHPNSHAHFHTNCHGNLYTSGHSNCHGDCL